VQFALPTAVDYHGDSGPEQGRYAACCEAEEAREARMSAAVIGLRIKRIFEFLRERKAVSRESAIPESEVPYSDRWYYARLVEFGAVKRVGDKCYLDEAMAQSYSAARRRRGIIFIAATIAVFLLWRLLAVL
jgi:hypothetical protein